MSISKDITKSPRLSLTRRTLVRLVGAIPLFVSSTFAATPRPAMWIARRGNATAYLFGQMPLPTATQWMTQELEAAFKRCNVLWLENPEYNKSSPDVMAAVTELSRRTAVDASYSVLELLDPESATRLEQILAEEGLPRDSLDGKAPGDVRQWLSAVADKRTEADYNAIPEAHFRKRANEAGMEIRTEWRDLLEVVAWSAAAPPEVQLDTVRMALDDVARAKTYQAELSSWIEGDLDIQESVAEHVNRKYPRLYRRLSVERNAKLAERIAQLMNEGRTQFVCIGILHLLGPGSVQEQLRRSGARVGRA